MSNAKKFPLIEAIFELHWGEIAGRFNYTENEQYFFPGRLSVAASNKKYKLIERIPNQPSFPKFVTHRFREKENSWPCFQLGLGIFTINQVNDGYNWATFKDTIKEGLEIFQEAEPLKLEAEKSSLSINLRYQDAFFPDSENSIEDYLNDHFNIKTQLPPNFSDDLRLSKKFSSINLRIDIDSLIPKGIVSIIISNALINNKPGLLMETMISVGADEVYNEKTSFDAIMDWVENAHDIQKHAFNTLINPSAYEKE